MRLKKRWSYSRTAHLFTIAGAVEAQCDGSDSESGAVESARASVRATAALLGKLVETLHEHSRLTDVQVLELLSDFEADPT